VLLYYPSYMNLGGKTVTRGNLYARFFKTMSFKINSILRTLLKNPRISNLDAIKLHVMLSIRRSNFLSGYTVAQLVEALRYKPKGRGFSSR
jgi:hypothetical protein